MNRLENIVPGLSVRIIHGHWIHHDNLWKEQKTRENYSLWSVAKGKIWITAVNNTCTVKEGDAVLFYPGCSYSAHTDGDGCEFIFLFFTLEAGNGLDLLAEENLEGVASGDAVRYASLQFQRDFNAFSIAHPISLKLYTAFLSYLGEITEAMRGKAAVHFSKHARAGEIPAIRRTLDYIGSHYLDNPSVRQMAEIANLSEKHFISSFKNMVGLPPGQYISQMRMRRAAELVSATDMKIGEIAFCLGYADPYSFSKAFKKAFGEAPMDFRRNLMRFSENG